MAVYSIADLINLAPGLFHVSKADAAGALYGYTGTMDETVAGARIQSWLGSPAVPASQPPPAPSTLKTQVQELIDWSVNHGRYWLELDERPYDNSGGVITLPQRFEVHGKGFGTMVTVANLFNTNVLAVGQKAKLSDMRLYVDRHNSGPAFGTDPSNVGAGTGVVRSEWQSHSTGEGLTWEGFWTPAMLTADHITFRGCETVACEFGMVRVGGNSNGNLHTERCYFTGNTVAGHWCAAGVQEDSWFDADSHFGFEPFCLYAQPDAGREFAYTNVDLNATSFEAWGNRVWGLGIRKMSGVVTQPRTGMWDLANGNSGPQFFWSGETNGMNNHDYAVESGNVGGFTAAQNEGVLQIITAGGDQYNGSFVGGGSVGVFLNH